MSKKGRRTKRDEVFLAKIVAEAQAKIAAVAASEAISEEVVRERMIELARVREQVEAHYAGTGTVVKDVSYNAKENRIYVTIAPGKFGVYTRESRTRTAIFELQQGDHRARTALPFMGKLR